MRTDDGRPSATVLILTAWNVLAGLWLGDEAIRSRRGEVDGLDSVVLGCLLTAVLAAVGISRDLLEPAQVVLIAARRAWRAPSRATRCGGCGARRARRWVRRSWRSSPGSASPCPSSSSRARRADHPRLPALRDRGRGRRRAGAGRVPRPAARGSPGAGRARGEGVALARRRVGRGRPAGRGPGPPPVRGRARAGAGAHRGHRVRPPRRLLPLVGVRARRATAIRRPCCARRWRCDEPGWRGRGRSGIVPLALSCGRVPKSRCPLDRSAPCAGAARVPSAKTREGR